MKTLFALIVLAISVNALAGPGGSTIAPDGREGGNGGGGYICYGFGDDPVYLDEALRNPDAYGIAPADRMKTTEALAAKFNCELI